MNYKRFYALLSRMPTTGDRDYERSLLVNEASGGRTSSLRELTSTEYESLCRAMEERVTDRDELKRERSATLRLMAKYGVDTTEWANVDNFCLQSRISGKVFRQLSVPELKILIKKLRAIIHKSKNSHP